MCLFRSGSDAGDPLCGGNLMSLLCYGDGGWDGMIFFLMNLCYGGVLGDWGGCVSMNDWGWAGAYDMGGPILC